MIRHPLQICGFDLAFKGLELERSIQWTKSNKGCEQENNCKDEKDNPQCAGYNSTKVKVSKYSGKNNTDQTVKV
jgi:hypothetical protein